MHIIRKYYFIDKFDTNNIDNQKTNTGIIYRNYNEKNNLNTIIKIKKYDYFAKLIKKMIFY